jgi:hypothetical protein
MLSSKKRSPFLGKRKHSVPRSVFPFFFNVMKDQLTLADSEIQGRRDFNDKYFDGQHEGINEEIGKRTKDVEKYDEDIRRFEYV